jgi:hypothetical protein
LSKYLEERQQELSKADQSRQKEAVGMAEGFLGRLDWFAEKKIEAGADEAAKKAAEDHNVFLKELKPQLAAALQEDSPEMKATMVTGLAKLFYLQRQLPALEAALAEKTKALEEITAKWEAVKRSSQSRLNESQAPSGGIPQIKKDADINARPADALDDIARRVMEARSQAAAGQ